MGATDSGERAGQPGSVLPTILGTSGPEGFVVREQAPLGRSLRRYGLVIALLALLLAGPVMGLVVMLKTLVTAGWTGAALAVVVVVGLYRAASMVMRTDAIARLVGTVRAPGELVVARWPLRLGDEARISYRARIRPPARVERIEARLVCLETVGADLLWREHVSEEILPAVAPAGSAQRTLRADWSIHIPRQGPPSFDGQYSKIEWRIAVGVCFAAFPAAGQHFRLLVRPEVVP